MNYYNKVKQFGGVYSRDNIPRNIEHKFYIVNLDDAAGPGSHWVCIFNCHPDVCYYFDSFGVDPSTEVLQFMKQSHKKILMSTYQIQKLGTIMCGYFCIYVCNQLLNQISFCDILLQFDPKNYQHNDKIIMTKLFLS